MDIIRFDEIGSTNDYLMEYCKNNQFNNGLCVTSKVQTKGKGRNNRQWSSNEDGLYLSVVYDNDTALFPFITCLCVIGALKELGFTALAKWPNDIIVDKKKVCGILCESVFIGSKRRFTVSGMGINVNNTVMPEEIKHKASSLYLLGGKAVDKELLMENILNEFKLWTKVTGADIIKRYKEHCLSLNKDVFIVEKNQVAFANDVNPDGSLKVTYKDGKSENIIYGDVSVRGLGGYVD